MFGLEIYDAVGDVVFNNSLPIMRKFSAIQVNTPNDGSSPNPIMMGSLRVDNISGFEPNNGDFMIRPLSFNHFFGELQLTCDRVLGRDYAAFNHQKNNPAELVLFDRKVQGIISGEYGIRIADPVNALALSDQDNLFCFDSIIAFNNPTSIKRSYANSSTYLGTVSIPSAPAGFNRFFSIISPKIPISGGYDAQVVGRLTDATTLDIYSHIYGLSVDNGVFYSAPALTHYIYSGYAIDG